MRIAVCNNFFPPRTGGSAHLSEALARELVARGHEVLVITGSFRDAPAEEFVHGYRVVRLPAWYLPKTMLSFNFDINFVTTPRNVRRVFALLDEFQPDLIHQHGQLFDLTFVSSAYAARRGVPVVLSVHSRLEHPNALADIVFRIGDAVLVRTFVRLPRPHVIAMDRLMERYIQQRYGIPKERIVGIPVGIDPERFERPVTADVRREHGIGDAPMILSIGHVSPFRSRMTLVEAMPRVLEDYPDARFVVVGRTYTTSFIDRAVELGVRENLIVVGEVPSADIPNYVAAADIEAHDLDGAGCGTANLEVMAAGVPTIVAVRPDNFLGIELRTGSNIVLVPPTDPDALGQAIVAVLADPAGAARIAEGQKELIRSAFTMDVVATQHEELFRMLVDGSTSGSPDGRSV